MKQKREKPGGSGKGKGHSRSKLDLPQMIEVRKDDCENHGFDRDSALKVVDSGVGGYDFYINMDNINLLTEKKAVSSSEIGLVDSRYKFGLTLMGLSLIRHLEEKTKDGENGEIPKQVFEISKALSTILIPMIDELGAIKIEDIESISEAA